MPKKLLIESLEHELESGAKHHQVFMEMTRKELEYLLESLDIANELYQ